MSTNREKPNPDDPDFIVEQVVGSLNIEGIRVPDDEQEILRRIARGEIDADDYADEIVRQALHENTKSR